MFFFALASVNLTKSFKCFICHRHNHAPNPTLNTLRPGRNRRHFADNIFTYIFLKENVWISMEMLLKFVPKGPFNNIPALVQIMAWRRPGDKSLSEPMMVTLPTHICVTRPKWVKNGLRSAAFYNVSASILTKFQNLFQALHSRIYLHLIWRTVQHKICHILCEVSCYLTNWPLERQRAIMELDQHWSRWWLVAWQQHHAIAWTNVG